MKREKTRRRRGRPELPADQVRKSPLTIRLSESERELLEREAAAAGEKTVSMWVRKKLLGK